MSFCDSEGHACFQCQFYCVVAPYIAYTAWIGTLLSSWVWWIVSFNFINLDLFQNGENSRLPAPGPDWSELLQIHIRSRCAHSAKGDGGSDEEAVIRDCYIRTVPHALQEWLPHSRGSLVVQFPKPADQRDRVHCSKNDSCKVSFRGFLVDW